MSLLPSCDKVSPVTSSCDDNQQRSEPELLLAPGLPDAQLPNGCGLQSPRQAVRSGPMKALEMRE